MNPRSPQNEKDIYPSDALAGAGFDASRPDADAPDIDAFDAQMRQLFQREVPVPKGLASRLLTRCAGLAEVAGQAAVANTIVDAELLATEWRDAIESVASEPAEYGRADQQNHGDKIAATKFAATKAAAQPWFKFRARWMSGGVAAALALCLCSMAIWWAYQPTYVSQSELGFESIQWVDELPAAPSGSTASEGSFPICIDIKPEYRWREIQRMTTRYGETLARVTHSKLTNSPCFLFTVQSSRRFRFDLARNLPEEPEMVLRGQQYMAASVDRGYIQILVVSDPRDYQELLRPNVETSFLLPHADESFQMVALEQTDSQDRLTFGKLRPTQRYLAQLESRSR